MGLPSICDGARRRLVGVLNQSFEPDFKGVELGMTAVVREIRPLVAGNWKMNGLASSIDEARRLANALMWGSAPGGGPAADPGCDVMICPPATLIGALASATAGTRVVVGGQDCHAKSSGAHTGDVAAEMLADSGAKAVIVGHSERRADHGETDAIVLAKATAVHRAGLVAIICVGETAAQRKAGETLAVVAGQLAGSVPDSARDGNTVIAYEPVWAIGTGLVPTTADVAAVHLAIRTALIARFGADGAATRILYGGSVKASNARELMRVDNVNGALVGGASLKADDFLGIIAAYKD
jgi:triosephosphate isomerase (TIM)